MLMGWNIIFQIRPTGARRFLCFLIHTATMTMVTVIRATLNPNTAAIVMPTLSVYATLSVLSPLFASVTLSVTFSLLVTVVVITALLVLSVALSGLMLCDDVSLIVRLVIAVVISSLLLLVALEGGEVVTYPE